MFHIRAATLTPMPERILGKRCEIPDFERRSVNERFYPWFQRSVPRSVLRCFSIVRPREAAIGVDRGKPVYHERHGLYKKSRRRATLRPSAKREGRPTSESECGRCLPIRTGPNRGRSQSSIRFTPLAGLHQDRHQGLHQAKFHTSFPQTGRNNQHEVG